MIRLTKQTQRTAPNQREKLELIGAFLLAQVRQRFLTNGLSGSVPWPQRVVKDWGYDNGTPTFNGVSGRRFGSFHVRYPDDHSVELYSDDVGAHLDEYGTVSKGGRYPDIVPTKSKALFIPITDRAKTAHKFTGPEAAFVRSSGGLEKMSGAIRASKTAGVYMPLIPGKLIDGRLHIRDDDGDWIPGVPDFIFLKRVGRTPRPALPTSPPEKAAQTQYVAQVFRVGDSNG
jgi:hypothetical protein